MKMFLLCQCGYSESFGAVIHFIVSADEWGYIRELRNEIAHDYPLMENDIVSVLNELISKVSILKSIYKRMKATV